DQAMEASALTGAKIIQTNNPKEAVKDADVIYTDVWTSMGFEEEEEIRMKAFADFQVNTELVQEAKEDYLFMHCLPARDRKSTRLNSSHVSISYAVFCLKK